MKQKAQVLDEFWLKILGIFFMTCDHVGAFVYYGYVQQNGGSAPSAGSATAIAVMVLRIFGRFAFPLFAFMLAEGLHKSHDRRRYLLRLFYVWAPIALVELVLFFQGTLASLAMAQAFTDLLCFALFIYFIEKPRYQKLLALLPLAYIGVSFAAEVSEQYASTAGLTSQWSAYFPSFLRCDYSLLGFLIFLGFYYARPLSARFIRKTIEATGQDFNEYQQGKEFQSLVNILGGTFFLFTVLVFYVLFKYLPNYDPYAMGTESWCLLCLFLIEMYNGRRGYDSKAFRYISYLYFPVHLALLAGLFAILFL